MRAYRGYKARKSLARSQPPTRREILAAVPEGSVRLKGQRAGRRWLDALAGFCPELAARSEEHTSELQSHSDLVCRLLLEKKKTALDDVPYVETRATPLVALQ